jgi:hypothetical protein
MQTPGDPRRFFSAGFAELNLIPIFGGDENVYSYKRVVEPQARNFVT